MEKGLEISFQLKSGLESIEIVEALANIIGNRYKGSLVSDWRIFHVTLGNEKFFKVLYTGNRIGKIHRHNEKEIREAFDALSRSSYQDLMQQYSKVKNKPGFETRPIKELKEEYDLWEDKLWQYI